MTIFDNGGHVEVDEHEAINTVTILDHDIIDAEVTVQDLRFVP